MIGICKACDNPIADITHDDEFCFWCIRKGARDERL